MAPTKRMEPAVLEGVRIIWPNFTGRQTQYNPAGSRNFCVVLEPEVADQMARDGWNVKSTNPRDEYDEPLHYIQVAVKYDFRPPKVSLVTSRGRNPLDESLVGMVDGMDIKYADLVLNGSVWNVSGKSGVKAYLKNAYIVLEEDDLDRKYESVPVLGGGGSRQMAIESSENPWTEEGEVLEDLGETL